MAYWWVVNTDTETLVDYFDDAGKERNVLGHEQQWLQVPEGVAPGNVEIENNEGVLSLVESGAKIGPKWDALRSLRNQKLAASDWTQLNGGPLSSGQKTAWATYRQALRNLPENTVDPENVTWPEEP